MRRIADYALLGDCQGAALVSREGGVEWWCAPRFDSRSSFARMLDPDGGHWTIRPAEPFEVERRYLPGTLVLETTFRTAGGAVRLTDALALGAGERGHEIGLASPHRMLRLVEGLEGEVELRVELVPRPEYGLVVPRIEPREHGLETVGGTDALTLVSDAGFDIAEGRATSELRVRGGDRHGFALQHHAAMRPGPLDEAPVQQQLAETVESWRSWSDMHGGYDGPYRDEVMRSSLVLQGLTYQPSGAVVAAPTTSLPEMIGGEANWDYRFAWLRDASMTLKALWVGACPDEAARYFDWMARAVAPGRDSAHVQIMFGVEGERDLDEHELPHLAGFRDSRPVRIGNGAWRQRQLDVLGEVLEAAWILRDRLGDLDPLTASFLTDLADEAARSWRQEDSGIWEGREGERHYTTSKLFCWVALDRAVELAPRLGAQDRVAYWTRERDAVRRTLLDRGWSERAGAFSGAFGSHHLDAGVLLMPLVGLLPADDRRMRATIDAVERELSHDGRVQRWTGSGTEGAFVICSYWLVRCRALLGEVERATELFEAVTAHANDLGLLAEEVDIQDGELLGNFPQALSHIGLINAAWEIAQARDQPIGQLS